CKVTLKDFQTYTTPNMSTAPIAPITSNETDLFSIIQGMGDEQDVKDGEEKLFSLPFAKELKDGTLIPENILLADYPKVLKTAVFLNMETQNLVEEYLWKLGNNPEDFSKVFNQDKKNSYYFYPKDHLLLGELMYLGKPPYHFYTLNA